MPKLPLPPAAPSVTPAADPLAVPPPAGPDDRPGRAPPSGPTRVGEAPRTPGTPATSSGAGLPLPHERDEAAGHVAPGPDPVIRQAGKDLAAGQVDTDMRATPGLDAERRGGMVPTPRPDEPPDTRPPRR